MLSIYWVIMLFIKDLIRISFQMVLVTDCESESKAFSDGHEERQMLM
jgi:hypothetical protein